MKGNTSEAKMLNNYLNALRNKIYIYYEQEMILDGREITFESFKGKWSRVDKEKRMVLEVFKAHNDNVAVLIGKDFAPGTLQRYKTSFDFPVVFFPPGITPPFARFFCVCI